MKFICEMKSDPKLKELFEKSQNELASLKNQSDFVTAQLSKILVKSKDASMKFWSETEARLEELNMLTEMDKETECLEYNYENGQMFIVNKCNGHSAHDLISDLIR